MKNRFPPLLAMIICFEMIVSPVVAQAQSALQVISSLSQVAGQALQQQQGGVNPQAQAQIAAITQQANTFTIDQNFNLNKLGKVPGLLNYLGRNGIDANKLNCLSLPAKPTIVKAEVCTLGFTPQAGMSLQPQIYEADAYQKAYEFLSSRYDNYSTETTNVSLNNGGPNESNDNRGLGCMNKAMQILNGFFAYRLNELDVLMAQIEAANNQFRELSKADLKPIEELTTVLDGGQNDTSRPDLFDFAKQFGGACASMAAGDFFNDTGKSSGLNGINKFLKQNYEQPANGSKYSAQSYSQASAAVETDIKNMAVKIAQQARLNFNGMTDPERGGLSAFIGNLRNSVSSTTRVNDALRPDLFADVQTSFLDKFSKLQTREEEISNVLSGQNVNLAPAISALRNKNSSNFDSAISNIENQIKNNCLQRQIQIAAGSLDSIVNKIRDRRASKTANQYNPNVLKARLKQIMSNPATTIEQKLEEIRLAETQTGSRYNLEISTSMSVSQEVNGKIQTVPVSARDIDTPYKYFSMLTNTCNLQYSKSVDNSSNQTVQSSVQALKNLRKEYESFAETTAQEMQQTVLNKLLNCPGDTGADTVGSCTPEKFNNATPGFCARTASTCAGKMRACTEATQQFVNQKKTERFARVNNYKTQMEANKRKIVGLFDSTFSRYLQEAEGMRSLFNVGFTAPTEVQREVPEGQRYLSKFAQMSENSPDGRLLLEDPDQYVEMFRKNIGKLKASVDEQQKQIMGNGGRGGVLGNHLALVKQNYDRAKRDTEAMAEQCKDKIAALRQYEADQQRKLAEDQLKKSQELGEKRQAVCNLYSMAQADPNGGCSESIKDMMGGDAEAVGKLKTWCRNNGFNDNGENGSGGKTAAAICTMKEYSNGTEKGTDLKGLCFEWISQATETKKELTDPKTGEKYRAVKNENFDDLIVAKYQSEKKGGDDYSAAPDAPAYCTAGDNSGRGINPFDVGSQLGRTLASPTGIGR